MFYTYVLQSKVDGDLYIGSTNDLRRRFKEHNSEKSRSTKARAPFTLIYYESYLSEEDARRREHSLKVRGQARRQLISRIQKSLLQSKS